MDTTNDIAARLEHAKNYAQLTGRLPVNFTTAIRTLMWDYKESDNDAISPPNLFLTVRLFRGPTMKALLYYAALTFHGDRIRNIPFLSSGQLLTFFTTREVAALIGVMYLYRKMKLLCPEEDWNILSKSLIKHIEIGHYVGYAIPNIGAEIGLLTGALRHLALAMFLRHGQKEFKQYRRQLKHQGLSFDSEYELSHWGCTSTEVAANLLQQLGFGHKLSSSYFLGLSDNPPKDDKDDKDAYRFYTANLWLTSLQTEGEFPDVEHRGEYYPYEVQAHYLLYQVQQLRTNGSKYSWLQKGCNDISSGLTPQLYQEALLEMQSPKDIEEYYKQHLPTEIVGGLSDEELGELTSADSNDDDKEWHQK